MMISTTRWFRHSTGTQSPSRNWHSHDKKKISAFPFAAQGRLLPEDPDGLHLRHWHSEPCGLYERGHGVICEEGLFRKRIRVCCRYSDRSKVCLDPLDTVPGDRRGKALK